MDARYYCSSPLVKDKNWEPYRERQEQKGSLSKYLCCREDGSPRGPMQPDRRVRQRGKGKGTCDPRWSVLTASRILKFP